ncbi:MAG: hypothetical protein KAW14_12055 [Candidatus Aegiribacteria sp.]|nr:hypothetical protein [Candidatus Aegiribacteria sp.]
MNDITWSKSEKKIARQAFDSAYQRECDSIIQKIKKHKLEKPEDIWSLRDMLEDRGNEIDKIYDFRYSRLIIVFAVLLKRGFLNIHDLEGLQEEKLEKIRGISDL